MKSLDNLKNERGDRERRRVGRGAGTGRGKTCGRGHKGSGSRSGYKRRLTYEGGQFRLFQKLPQRGFSQKRFQKRPHAINLGLIDRYFADGDVVNQETLRQHGLISGKCWGVKLLGEGQLTKKIERVEVDSLSASARASLENAGVPITLSEASR